MTSAEPTAETTAAPADGMDEFLTNEEFVRLWMMGLGSEKNPWET